LRNRYGRLQQAKSACKEKDDTWLGYKKEDLISFKMFDEQALKKLAILRGDMCKLYTNTET
jgi:hypothetical protein